MSRDLYCAGGRGTAQEEHFYFLLSFLRSIVRIEDRGGVPVSGGPGGPGTRKRWKAWSPADHKPIFRKQKAPELICNGVRRPTGEAEMAASLTLRFLGKLEEEKTIVGKEAKNLHIADADRS